MASASGGQQAATLNAVVIGGTGATGSHLVGTLLKAKDVVAKVTVMGRRKMEAVPERHGADLAAEEGEGRLVQHVEDQSDLSYEFSHVATLEGLGTWSLQGATLGTWSYHPPDLETVSDETVKQLCTGGHVFFNCMGTTRRRAGSAEAFRHIDYEIPTRLTRLAREAGVGHGSVPTAWGANPNSWFLYTRTKGQVESAAREMQFPRLSIFRPGTLDTGRGGFQYYIGKLLRSTHVAIVAEAMAQDAYAYHARLQQSAPEGATPTSPEVVIFTTNMIRQLSQGATSGEPSPPPPGEPTSPAGEPEGEPTQPAPGEPTPPVGEQEGEHTSPAGEQEDEPTPPAPGEPEGEPTQPAPGEPTLPAPGEQEGEPTPPPGEQEGEPTQPVPGEQEGEPTPPPGEPEGEPTPPAGEPEDDPTQPAPGEPTPPAPQE